MASTIKIKRSTTSGNPASLAPGELAYSALASNGSNGGDTLYVGNPLGGGAANIAIGGKFFTDLVSGATNLNTASTIVKRDASGNFNAGSITAALVGNADTATKWATARNISLTGDAVASLTSVDGSASVSAALTLATVNTNVGSFGSATSIPVITVNGKGLITAVSTASISTALSIAGDTGTDTVNIGADTFTFTGGAGITSAVADNVVTFDIDNTVALRADTTYVGTTAIALNRSSANLALSGISSVTLPGSTSGTIQIIPTAVAGTGTLLTLPATTGTLITSGDSGTVTTTMLAGSIPNAKLANSTISGVSLGGNLGTLTIGSGLSGTSYNGSGAVSIAIDSTVALRADTTYVGTTAIALNRSSANLALSGISSVTLPGGTSGSVQIIPTLVAGTATVLTLPATTGTVITSGDSGTVTSAMITSGTIVNANISASAAIAITKLASSTISGVSLGGNLATLTIGTGLSGTSYNGSGAVSIAIDSTVATLTGAQTLTNKTLTSPIITGTGGAGITFNGATSGTTVVKASAIAGTTTATLPSTTGTLVGSGDTATVTNVMLANSSTTINGTAIALGASGTVTASAGTLTGTSLNATVVSSSLTSVGTITSGTWNGTTIAVAYGGTGTTNGSITGTGALTFTAGGTNTNVVLAPNGTGTVDVSGKKITGLAEPTLSTDAATKNYVDNAITGLTWKAAVNVAAVGVNVPLTGATPLVIDGHTTSTTYRVLLTSQTTNAENGIYNLTITGATYSMARATDADVYTELVGASVFVSEGTTYANTGWVQASDYLTSFSGQTWNQFSGGGAYGAGNGLTLTGTTFDVGAGLGITANANDIALASSVAGNGLTYTSGVLDIGGTTNRITVGVDSVDISSSYVGQSSITTLGTVTTGTWSATTIATTKGGTGLTGYTTGDLVYSSATDTLAKLTKPVATSHLTMTSAGVPSWAALNATTITGLGTVTTGTWNATSVASNYGGTGVTTYAVGDLLYASSATAGSSLSKLSAGIAGQVLQVVGGVPVWGDIDGGTY